MHLAGQHAFVTGGSRGIGAAIAAALTQAGAQVTVAGRDGAALAAQCSAGHAALHVVADVTDQAALAQAIARAQAALGPVALLVNNAGSVETAPFAKTDAALFQRMFDVHLLAAVHAAHAVLPAMVARGHGRIVNVASTAALKGYPFVSAYVAAKHALLGLTRALASACARSGVTVNAVCPGYTATELVETAVAATAARSGKDAASVAATLVRDNPQGRFVTPAEVAAAVLYLCSPEAGATNGQAIAVDGGETMR